MLKKKTIISLLSVMIYVIVLVVMGVLSHKEGLAIIFWFTLYGVPIMLMVGMPVNILAGFLTRNLTRFRFITNALIHIIPGYLAGLLLFPGDSGLIGMFPVGMACLYFILDELIFHNGLHKKSALLLPLFPIVIIGALHFPEWMKHNEISQLSDFVKKNGKPVGEVTLRNETKRVETSYCIEGYSYGICNDNKPTILPLADISETEFNYKGPAELSFNVSNSFSSSYEFVVKYYENSRQKELKTTTVDQNTITLPKDIPEQIIVIEAYSDREEQVTFSVGLRNGVRYNPINEGINDVD